MKKSAESDFKKSVTISVSPEYKLVLGLSTFALGAALFGLGIGSEDDRVTVGGLLVEFLGVGVALSARRRN